MQTTTTAARNLRTGDSLVGGSGLTYEVQRVWKYRTSVRVQLRGLHGPTFRTFANTDQVERLGDSR